MLLMYLHAGNDIVLDKQGCKIKQTNEIFEIGCLSKMKKLRNPRILKQFDKSKIKIINDSVIICKLRLCLMLDIGLFQ